MLFWLVGSSLMFAMRNNYVWALFWDRFVYMGVSFMPPLMHHFSLVFTHYVGKKQRSLLVVNYIFATLSFFASQTPYFVDGLYYYSWGVHSQARILHTVFLVYFFLGTGIFFRNLIKYYWETSDRIIRKQIIFVFVAFGTVIFIGGVAYLFAYNIDTKFPFSYVTGLIFPVMLFYTVSRHRLLGTRVVATELSVGITEFFVVMQIFFSREPLEIVIRSLFAIAVGFVSVLLIKSVRREAQRQEELSQLAYSLEQANLRLKEIDKQKTDFLSIAAHQLRTPLSIINGYTELITEGAYGKVGKGIKRILVNIDESNGHLVKLVDEFLDITRIEQGRTRYDFAKQDIRDIIDSVIKEMTDRAEGKALHLVWSRAPVILQAVVDAEKIRHVIFNFIDNAIKYSNEGTIRVVAEKSGVGIAVRVIDDGFGFGQIDQANFFQKFYRGENVKGTNVNGTGLGLYVCRMFIEGHGGRVWAISPGLKKGSEFGFWVPLKQKKA